jgi:flagellar hook-basal body complex protein FliE
MIDQVSIARLYGASPMESSSQVRVSESGGAAGKAGGDKEFVSVLANMVSGTIDTVKTAEQTSAAGVRGQASVQQVVEAVMAAEQSLQSSLAVRDKIVAAYLEISRMQI